LFVASYEEFTPAGFFADETFVVPPIRDPQYIDRLLELCRSRAVRVVVPLIDQDLERLTPHLDRFAAIGTAVVCPPPDLVDLCMDKLRFARFAARHGLSHPKTIEAAELGALKFPLFFKKRRGHGSLGSGMCVSMEQARAQAASTPDLLFQECIEAPEVTVDAYIALDGRCTICVPRLRQKIVAGEAHTTCTIRDEAVTGLAMKTISALAREGFRGPLNVQMFRTDPPQLIEVNTRLGSAHVLANVATRGRLHQSVLRGALGETVAGKPDDYIVGLTLTRFLGDVFHQEGNVIAPVTAGSRSRSDKPAVKPASNPGPHKTPSRRSLGARG
jgi:carbamoyl-phosphate synthase large subunit